MKPSTSPAPRRRAAGALRPVLLALATLSLCGAAEALDVKTRAAAAPVSNAAAAQIARGKYIVQVGGCNDCHTAGYPEAAGKIDEKLWLAGNPVGWQGPWGTTYPSNLRLVAQRMDETQWLKHARTEWRPPMPWFNLRDMSDADLKAVYRYLKHLGPTGTEAPAYAPPGKAVPQPYVSFPAPPKTN